MNVLRSAAACAALVVLAVSLGGPAACPAADAAPTAAGTADAAADAAPAAPMQIVGHWTGAKLRCQKEEGKLARCGTPASFEITFEANGEGATPDEHLPKAFSWRWLSPTEIGMTSKAGGEEVKLFSFEQPEVSLLTFQAYVFLPTADPNVPAAARYIHYIFDVNLSQ